MRALIERFTRSLRCADACATACAQTRVSSLVARSTGEHAPAATFLLRMLLLCMLPLHSLLLLLL